MEVWANMTKQQEVFCRWFWYLLHYRPVSCTSNGCISLFFCFCCLCFFSVSNDLCGLEIARNWCCDTWCSSNLVRFVRMSHSFFLCISFVAHSVNFSHNNNRSQKSTKEEETFEQQINQGDGEQFRYNRLIHTYHCYCDIFHRLSNDEFRIAHMMFMFRYSSHRSV